METQNSSLERGGGMAAMPAELVGSVKRREGLGAVRDVDGLDAARGPFEMEGIDAPRALENVMGGGGCARYAKVTVDA